MMMKRLLFALIIVGALSGAVQAQTILTNTTLSAAVNQNQTTITVASATGFTVGYQLVISDTGGGGVEAMRITAINGTTISVVRGVDGTAARGHSNSARVWLGASSTGTAGFMHGPPQLANSGSFPGAACTRASIQYLPLIDLDTGNIWTCLLQSPPTTASTWVVTNPMVITYSSIGQLR